MAEQDSDRSEQATPHKLEEARKKGSVVRSMDMTAVGVLSALLLIVYSSAWSGLAAMVRLLRKALSHASAASWSSDIVAHWLGGLLMEALMILAPLLMALLVCAVVINLVQTGPVFSFEPLKPDMDRINPASGFKRIFSMRTLFEGVKSTLKLAVLGTVVYFLIKHMVPGLVGLPGMEAKGYLRVMVDLCAALLGKLVLALFVIALLDYGFARWEFGRRMRMSKRDVKDETKNREGDPRIRSRIRELRKEMLKRSQTLGKVPSADVLITNPTHLAVAVSYKHGTSAAPQVVAKGAGEMARKMRELAGRHQIPVVQNRPLARALFREVDFDGFVPEKLYPQVAKIMVWVYSMRQVRREGRKVV